MKSASIKQLAHYGQLISSGDFAKFDYNFWGNPGKYWSLWPPKFDVKKINVPIALLNGKDDRLADKIDVDRLYKELGDKVVLYKEYDQMDHNGFTVGRDMSWTRDVLALLEHLGGNKPKPKRHLKLQNMVTQVIPLNLQYQNNFFI